MIKYILIIGLFILISAKSQAQHDKKATEEIIRQLEKKESVAVVDRDLETLNQLWADDFMVNNPANQIINGKEAVFARIKSGFIHYLSFERNIESVMVLDNITIVMGLETLKPTGNAPMAGQTIERRYTNIWMRESGQWKVKARHANVICPPPAGTR
jgi:ketosteroid isomerase-like protein